MITAGRTTALAVSLLFAATAPLGAQTPADSPHGPLSFDCAVCHNTADWSVAPRPAGFDHARTGFPLAGRHGAVECRDCHRELTFGHVGSACADCHADVHRGQLGDRCERCHSPAGWENRGQLFEQHAARGFPLVGVHAAADCEACHVGQQRQDFAGTPVSCYGCHAGDYARTADSGIPHAQVGFGTDCQQCHTPTAAWGPVTWDHAAITGFALTGRHAAANCVGCHPGGQWAGRPRDCDGCHHPDFQATANPPHAEAAFALTCQDCHTTAGWQPSSWSHASTGFALTGAHTTTNCTSCHASGRWAGTPQDCYSCHAADFNGTTEPPHAAAGMPHDCTQCHNTATWGDGSFDHAASTGFALTGAHATASCVSCHANGRWAGTPTDCNGCHSADYAGTTVPAHGASGFATTCQTCHSTTAWQPSTWSHASTGFALTGAHTTTNCTACHTNNQWPGLATDCYGCHAANYNATTDPPHAAAGMPHDCTQCHNTATWGDGSFDHAASTGFALTGAHATASCVSCHANGRWAGTPTDCNGCHSADYAGTTVPAHGASGFATTCQTCHSTTAWQPSTWSHASTGFALTGAHTTTNCTACHTNNQWPGLATDCYGCHAANYNATTDPPHAAAGMPHDCTQCHNTATWGDGSFDHAASTGFALTGAHATASCVSCHANGRWAGTPTDCNGCHAADYDGTASPAHAAASFPRTCQTCHTTTVWQPSTWNHTQYFPINSGNHDLPCVSCHQNIADYQQFECILCHTHSQSTTTNQHSDVRNFQWVSSACYNCHPTGRGDG